MPLNAVYGMPESMVDQPKFTESIIHSFKYFTSPCDRHNLQPEKRKRIKKKK